MGKSFKFLQISDLHILESTDWNIMEEKYKEQLLRHNIEFVIVTGDLHQYGDNYDKTITFLSNLVSSLHLTKNDVFVVPGNHDSENYNAKSADILYVRETIEKNQDSYLDVWNESRLYKSFDNYKKFIQEFYRENLQYIDPTQVQLINWKDKIQIIHLNSAILCDGDNSQKQIVDVRALSKILSNRDFNLPAIIIAHHDCKCLYPNQLTTLKRLASDLGISAYLCGDLHKVDNKPIDALIGNIPCITCGKATIENGDLYSDVGFIIYNVESTNSNVQFTLHPYEWNKDRKRFEESQIFSDDNGNPFTIKSVIGNIEEAKPHKINTKNKINSTPYSIWLPDAEFASGLQARFTDYTTTPSIESFVSSHSLKWGISAVKGIGKTFALQIKKAKLSKNYLCLPMNIRPSNSNNWGIDSVLLNNIGNKHGLKVFDNIVNLWKYSFLCYVINQCINNFDKTDNINHQKILRTSLNRLSQETNNLCTDKAYCNLNFIINSILECKDWEIIIQKDWNNLALFSVKLKEILTLKKKKYFAIFVDKIDQSIKQTNAEPPANCEKCSKANYFNTCQNMLKSEQYCSSSDCNFNCCFGCELFDSSSSNINLRIYDKNQQKIYEHINLWQYIQLGLISAIEQIKTTFDSIIKIFYTIRQEAFACESQILSVEQIKKVLALTERLYYNKTQQHQIFFDCISRQHDIFLYDASLKNTQQKEFAFAGVSSLCHPYVGTYESVFDSIYRHTFDRTRDIQEFAQTITDSLPTIRTFSDEFKRGEFIKNLIEEKAASIAYSNNPAMSSANESYFDEKCKFLPNYWSDRINFENLILKIDRNVLFMDDIRSICSSINAIDKSLCDGKCNNNCCIRHPFSVLFQLGFLGYIRKNNNFEMEDKQVFKDSKDISYVNEIDIIKLNDDVLYILHPALTKSIERIKKQHILHFNGFILGKDIMVNTNELTKIINDHHNLSKMDFDKSYFGKKQEANKAINNN